MSINIVPPFTDPELAVQKVKIAQDVWNTRNAERVALAYTANTQWRNRTEVTLLALREGAGVGYL